MEKKYLDKVAKSKGNYKNWEDYYNWISREGQYPSVVAQLIEASVKEAYKMMFNEILNDIELANYRGDGIESIDLKIQGFKKWIA